MKTNNGFYRNLRRTAGAVLNLLALALAPSLTAMNGVEGTFEFACDAPWRIEPQRKPDGTLTYGAIPIQVSIHDAKEVPSDSFMYHQFVSGGGSGVEPVILPPAITSLGRFLTMRVRQIEPPTSTGTPFYLNDFHEIEMTVGAWPWPSDAAHPAPAYKLCRRWAGEDPEPFRDLRNTSEWHGSVWYQPRTAVPGSTITLEIEVVLERDAWTPNQIKGVFTGKTVPIDLASRLITLRNYVRVHFGEEQLPRFDRRWVYGDLHYHSQGTDNEGESGYNYRGVVRAMGAMGMDFVFATDHASNSEQLMDLDLHIDLFEEGLGTLGGDVDQLEEDDADMRWGVLRDMDSRRYRFSHGLIYGPRGVNREAALQGGNQTLPKNYLSYRVVPQIFLGGEVDAVPELKLSSMGTPPPPNPGVPPALDPAAYVKWLAKAAAYKAWTPAPVKYGNGLSFDLTQLKKPGNQPMVTMYETAGDAYLVHDFQGLDTYSLYGREHLVYFPASSTLTLPNGDTTFISSSSSRFGGATRRLDASHKGKAALLPEIERKGIAFVAHHLNAGSGSRGPDASPWTLDHMLLKAFRSPAIMGLEFWNEDSRFKTRVCSHGFCSDDGFLGRETGYERDEYFSIFGYQPSELTDVALALPGVRQGFITGGFTGSEFELKPFSLPDGRWESATLGTEHSLHHGAHDWDQMNLMGLDFENQAKLPWLPAGEPRRVFMGGGSDAHGDLNYRREGYFLGAEEATDTAIGKPRNLVFAGDPQGPVIYDPGSVSVDSGAQSKTLVASKSVTADVAKLITAQTATVSTGIGDVGGFTPSALAVRPHTQEQVINALKQGHYSITDGPAIRIAIDLNGNNVIDDGDIQMGDIYRFEKKLLPLAGHQTVNLLVECVSTPEFGPIDKIDLYVGVHPGLGRPNGQRRVYAPASHGVRDLSRAPGNSVEEAYLSQGRFYARMQDGYWQSPDLVLRAPAGKPFRFTIAKTIDLDQFEVSKGYTADRFFVRAFAKTIGNPAAQKPSRYAFTNPIWLLRSLQIRNDLPIFTLQQAPPEAPGVSLKRNSEGEVLVEFNGILQHSSKINGPYTDVAGAVSPFRVSPNQPAGFFRARN